MANSSHTPAPPVFVPRTVVSLERSATQLASRLMAPARTVGSRLLSFADRLISTWAGPSSFTSAAGSSEPRPMLGGPAQRVAPMQMARPWYETPAEVAARQPQVQARPIAAAPVADEPVVVTAALPVVEEVAARGASIERTQVVAMETPAPAADARTASTEPTAAPVSPVSPTATPVAAVPTAPTVPAPRLTVDAPKAPPAVEAAPTGAPPVVAPASSTAEPAAPVEVRAREWLQLGTTPVVAAPVPPAPAVRPAVARSITERILQHARWADEQLRSAAARDVEAPTLSTAGASYVFVAPPVPQAPQVREAARPLGDVSGTVEVIVEHTAPEAAPKSDVAPTPSVSAPAAPVSAAPVEIPAPAVVAALPFTRPSIEASAALSEVPSERTIGRPTERAAAPSFIGLPDLRVAAALPVGTAGADRVAAFLERLVGTQASRDVQLPALSTIGAAPTLDATAERAPSTVFVRMPDPTRVAEVESAVAPSSVASEGAPEVARAVEARVETPAIEAARSEAPRSASTTSAEAPVETRLVETRAPAAVAPTAVGEAPLSHPGEPARRDLAAALAPTEAPARPVERSRTLRPGGIGARAEQLATVVDVRAMAAWGAPTTSVAPSTATTRSTPTLSYLAPATAPAQTTTASSGGPARYVEFVDRLVASELMRDTAPLSIASAMAERPKVSIEVLGEPVRNEAPRAPIAAARAATAAPPRSGGATSSLASAVPSMPVVRSVPAGAAQTHSVTEGYAPVGGVQLPAAGTASAAPVAGAPSAPTPPSAPQVTRQVVRVPARLASAGLRAEQLAGIIGVRAADLSIDFVDPSALPALFGAQSAPEMSFVRTVAVRGADGNVSWSPTTGASASTAAPQAAEAEVAQREAAREAAVAPLVARATSGARLTTEEWALVATFPSAATAVQLAATRRSTQFLGESVRASAAPQRTLLTAGSRFFTPSQASSTASFGLAGGWASTSGYAPGGEGAPAQSLRIAEQGGAPGEFVAPTTPERSRLPDGRQPRGGFIWPRIAGFTTTTAAAVEQAASAADRSEAAEHAAQGTPLWEAMRPSMVTLSGGPDRAESSTASDIELARPFLELVQGGVSHDESRSEGVRFFEQAAPVVSAAPSTEAASKMVEAVRMAPSHTPSDDRITLGDLTLIAVASATGQMAASPAGGAPAAPAPSGGEAGGGSGGGGKGGGKGGAPDIMDLAQKVYDELQRVMEIQRERSGAIWEQG